MKKILLILAPILFIGASCNLFGNNDNQPTYPIDTQPIKELSECNRDSDCQANYTCECVKEVYDCEYCEGFTCINACVEIDKSCRAKCSNIPVGSSIFAVNSTTTDNGWYYGNLNQKKPGTPSSWLHNLEGSRSAVWYDPSKTMKFKKGCDCDQYVVEDKGILNYPSDYLLENTYVPEGFVFKEGAGNIEDFELLKDIYRDIDLDIVTAAYSDVYVKPESPNDEIGTVIIKYSSKEALISEQTKIKKSAITEDFIYLQQDNILIVFWSDSSENKSVIRKAASKVFKYLYSVDDESKFYTNEGTSCSTDNDCVGRVFDGSDFIEDMLSNGWCCTSDRIGISGICYSAKENQCAQLLDH